MKKAAIYIRVSTEAQQEGYSIGAQKEALTAYCISRNIKEYEYYIDGGFSGSHLKRPSMERLIMDIQENRISHVLVYKLDRLSRSQKDTLYLIEDVFNPHEVSFVSLHESMDTGTPMGRLMLGILSAFAQLERENIRERTRMGMQERVRQGYWMGGGRVPFGYDYDARQGILVKNQQADLVRQMYLWYLEGYSPQNIADLTGLTYDRQVIQILKRKTNLGLIPFRGKEYLGKHEPLVSRELFDAVQLEMERRSRTHQHAGVHLLTGLLRCGHCGAGMRYQKWGKKGHKLVCYSRDKSKGYLIRQEDCPQEPVWSDEIEEAVLDDLFSFGWELEGQGEAEEILGDILEKQKKSLEKKLERLYSLYGDTGDEALLKVMERTRGELDMVKRKCEMEEERRTLTRERRQLAGRMRNLKELWPHLSMMEKRQILLTCLKEIKVRGTQIELCYQDLI